MSAAVLWGVIDFLEQERTVMIQLGKVKMLPAREQVASILRKAILSRELLEGQEITLEGIASQVGVSSMPVREAFQILASDGLIRLRPNKGAVVLGINEKTIRDHYETRALLESETAARCCGQGKDISAVANAYHMAVKALEQNDASEYSYHNQMFHVEIWTCAGNEKMKLILSSLWNGLSMGHKVTQEQYAQISIMEHKKILDAIEANDAAKARQEMYHHITRSMENILTHYQREEA